MNKLTLKKGNQTIKIIINKRKYLLGNNYTKKHILIQVLREYFSGIKQSEYSSNGTGKVDILLDDKTLSLKDCFFFEVNPFFNLTNDLKLSSKSLTARYLETIYNSETFYDLINTINILLTSLSDELDSESLIHNEFNTLQSKQLLKLVTPQLIVENQVTNEFDLSYDEIIALQLKMIKYILENTDYNISILLISLPELSDDIRKELNELKNCITIIDTDKYKSFMDLDELLMINSNYVDLSDEEEMYNLINNSDNSFNNLTMEEIKMNLKQYLDKRQCEYSRSIESLLK